MEENKTLFWIVVALFVIALFALLYVLELWVRTRIEKDELMKRFEAYYKRYKMEQVQKEELQQRYNSLKEWNGLPDGYEVGLDEEL